jgi:hypothetical protein
MSLDDFANEGGFVDFGHEDIGDTPDLTVIPDDTEVTLRLTALSMQVGKNSGNPFLLAMLEVKGEPDARDIRHMMMWPRDDMDSKQVANAKRRIKYFGQAFGIPLTGKVEFDKYLGREAVAILAVDPDEGYGESNRVKRWVTGA